MAKLPGHLPIIIGVGQTVERELAENVAELPSVKSLAVAACKAALADVGVADIVTHIDTLAFVRINADSIPSRPSPIGTNSNFPRAVATEIGANPTTAIYSIVGGQSPQQLVNEMTNRLAAGEKEVVLLTGAEAIGAMKHVLRNKLPVSWAEEVPGQLEDRGVGPELISDYEIRNGMGFPPQVYGAFENAWRHKQGTSKQDHLMRMSRLFAGFSKVASNYPYSQFPEVRDEAFLSTESYDNYVVADPYLKWHVAQDAVNQGAALILTTVGKAEALGIPQEKWVFPTAGADAQDKNVVNRPNLTESVAMRLVLERTLASAKTRIDEVQHLDIYSCFPIAVQFACDAMGIDAFSRQLTLTGGLPFFGGAGNNYSMHAIAAMVDQARAHPGELGLVLANGGFTSKESVGIYSTTPNLNWQPVDNTQVQAQISDAPDMPVVDVGEGGTIESYGLVYNKTVPFIGYAFCRGKTGGRFMARTDANDERTLSALVKDDPIGTFIKPEVTSKRNVLRF